MFVPVPGRSDDDGDKPAEPEPESQLESQPLEIDADPDIDEEAYTFALDCLLQGESASRICRRLIDRGYTKQQAGKVVEAAIQFRHQFQSRQQAAAASGGSGAGFIVIGLCLWMLGLLVRCGGSPGAALSLLMLVTDIIGLVFIIRGIIRFRRGRPAGP